MHKIASFLLPEAQNDFVLEVFFFKKKNKNPKTTSFRGVLIFFF